MRRKMKAVSDFSQFAEWAFKGLCSGGIALGVWHLKTISSSLSEMKMQLTAMFERLHWHKERLDHHDVKLDSHDNKINNHETRITKLEDRRKGN